MPRLLPLSLVLLAASTFVSAQTYTVLHDFGREVGDTGQLLYPGAIAQGRGGAILGTTSSEAFRLWPDASFQVLHQFGSGGPWGGLILATDGKFYGTTRTNGTFRQGTVFKMSQDGSITKLHDFTGGSDGAWPYAAPIQSVGGDFFGTTSGTSSAGHINYGSIYRITKYGKFTLLHTFTGSDGAYPIGPLVQGTDYYFYGTAALGGQNNAGTIFRVSSSGDFKVLVNFKEAGGAHPESGLIQATDSNFYGTTFEGGATGRGVLFRVTPGGTYTVLHNFTGESDGGWPLGGLVQASDGNLYGTTSYGTTTNRGVIFRATLTGHVVTVREFDSGTGASPVGALLQHTSGKLYGATQTGGKFHQGVFYSLDAELPPFVTYLPAYGRPGTLVQILGQGFTEDSVVSFNGTPAKLNVIYPTFIKAAVPDGATTGPITVSTANGILTSNKVFIVHPN